MRKDVRNIIAALSAAIIFLGCKQKEYKDAFTDPLLFSKTVKELNNVVKR